MAYPDYSLLLVETVDPETQVVTRNTYLFSNVNDANTAYRSEVASANNRVFLFEQPKPTKFKRNDSVPVAEGIDTWD
jgi:hypothetical protein